MELDPEDPHSVPRKHTSLGRFKHEGANVIIADNGKVVAYSGDDERFDYLYKFVSKNKYKKNNKAHNMTLLTEGDLYVAQFAGNSAGEIDGTGTVPADGKFDGKGSWLPLVVNGRSAIAGMTVQEVLVHTRLAADQAGATKMDRCEDVQPNQQTGKVYVACTNNTKRGLPGQAAADEVNPRTENRDGHIVELTERRGDATAFDTRGNLWISTDGAPSTIGYNDGLFRVGLEGRNRGNVQQFASMPRNAETCGPVIHDDESMAFVAVQHPGEEGTYTAQNSFFPDYVPAGTTPAPGQVRAPRPSIVQMFLQGAAGS